MNKIALIFSLSVVTLFANTIQEKKVSKELENPYLKTVESKSLSKRELAFQQYRKDLEKENQKLEEDGFCPCNNE